MEESSPKWSSAYGPSAPTGCTSIRLPPCGMTPMTRPGAWMMKRPRALRMYRSPTVPVAALPGKSSCPALPESTAPA